MAKKTFDQAFQYEDVPTIAETFVDGVHLVHSDGTMARIVLTVSRPDAPVAGKGQPGGRKATAVRLVLPFNGMLALYTQLDQAVRTYEERGLVNREGATLKSTVQ